MEQVRKAIRLGLEKDIAFVAYRLPGKREEVQVIMQLGGDAKETDIEELEQNSGFFIAPFESAAHGKMNYIQPDLVVSENSKPVSLDRLINLPDPGGQKNRIANHEMSRDDYMSRATYLVNMLNNSGLEKIVLSRMFNLPHIPGFQVIDFYLELIKKYPETFVYLFNLPGRKTWIGASPETLFSLTEKSAETMALAGTLPVDNPAWTKKEINEQLIVSNFIKEVLAAQNIVKYKAGKPVSIIAGNVVHIKTSFLFNPEVVKGITGSLVKALHPTPAVCGYPKEMAFELIRKVEKHERRFYTGFLGPWNLDGHSHLFVNLRCAEIGNDEMNLYVGGGITADSDPESEWEETLRKAQTLLTVVEKL